MAARPVRVLHVIDGLAGGGSEHWVFDIARLSDPRQVKHRVVTVHPDLGRYVYADGLREMGAYGAPRSAPRRQLGGRAGSVSAIAALVRRLRGTTSARRLRPLWYVAAVFPLGFLRLMYEWSRFGPDVIHGHTFHGFVFGLTLARLTGRPFVHTVPSLISQMDEVGFGWLPPLYVRYQPQIDAFFTAYPDELRRLGIEQQKIHEISGVVNLAEIESVRAERSRHRAAVRDEIGAAPDAPLALSVGRMHPSKGHDLGLGAIAAAGTRLPDLRWIVLGDGDERPTLEARAGATGLGDRIHFKGYVDDVLPYYAAADIYLRTTRLEAENQSSYQAMAMGLPVVGFDTGAGTELLAKVGHGILVPNGDAGRMAAAIVEILGAPDRGAALGERGRAFASANLGIDRTIAELTERYRKVAADRR